MSEGPRSAWARRCADGLLGEDGEAVLVEAVESGEPCLPPWCPGACSGGEERCSPDCPGRIHAEASDYLRDLRDGAGSDRVSSAVAAVGLMLDARLVMLDAERRPPGKYSGSVFQRFLRAAEAEVGDS